VSRPRFRVPLGDDFKEKIALASWTLLEAIKESLQTRRTSRSGDSAPQDSNRKTRMARNPRTGSPVEFRATCSRVQAIKGTASPCRWRGHVADVGSIRTLASQRSRGTARVHSDGAAVRFIRRKFSALPRSNSLSKPAAQSRICWAICVCSQALRSFRTLPRRRQPKVCLRGPAR